MLLPGTSSVVKLAIERLFRKLALKLPPAGSTSWTTPFPLAAPATAVDELRLQVPRIIRTQIVQAIGTIEQAVHVLHWAPIGGDAPAMSNAELKGFGDRVRDSWKLFLDDTAPGNPGGGASAGSYRQYMAPLATYTEVRTSLVTQAGPGPWVETGPGATQIQHPGAEQNQEGTTQLSAFLGNDGKALNLSQNAALPYEVAMNISMNTNFRGPRFRGRLYLGPLNTTVMGGDGLFNPATVRGIATNLGEFLDRINAAGDIKCIVYSSKFATWAPVQGTRAGIVPDSQRRRRRGQAENFVQAWGTPIGGAAG